MRRVLIKVVLYANLEFPALRVHLVERPCLGGISPIELPHREIGSSVDHLIYLEELAVEAVGHILLYAPLGVQQVAHIGKVG